VQIEGQSDSDKKLYGASAKYISDSDLVVYVIVTTNASENT